MKVEFIEKLNLLDNLGYIRLQLKQAGGDEGKYTPRKSARKLARKSARKSVGKSAV
jgi:hypothetical protein